MGLIKKGGNWFIDYYAQGRRVREKVGPSKARARQALAKRKTEILEGKFFPQLRAPAPLFSAFVARYWELHGRFRRSKSYPSMLKELLEVFGAMRLDRITVPMAMQYLNRVKERTSGATANRHHTLLKSMLNRAIEWGQLAGENPLAKIKKHREAHHRLRFLSEGEIARLLAAADPRLFPVLACALLTGMRRGEILGLDWKAVDLARGIIYVLESKSGRPREIPVSPKLARVLQELGQKTSGRVFAVPEITVRRLFKKALREAAIEEFRFHDLRHTFASHYIMRTGDLPALQKLLGHHSPMMTQRYAHLAAGHLRAGIAKLDAGMAGFEHEAGAISDEAPAQLAGQQGAGSGGG